jgi:hypothetical protein
MKESVLAVVIIIFLFAISCARNIKENRFVNENTNLKLVIADDSSNFKESIRDRLIAKYKSRANIQLISIQQLKGISSDDYDVIVIMDPCRVFTTFNWSFKKFLNKTEDRKNVVLSVTAANPHWQYSYKDVDAITSASRKVNEEKIFIEISDKIDKIIEGQTP